MAKKGEIATAPIGRPVLFESAEELQKAIDEYFDYCDNRIQQVFSKKSESVIEVVVPEPYTISGLCYTIGMTRETLNQYGKKDLFSDTIKKAKQRVAMDVERRLMEGNSIGAIFNLKNNFGWVDKQEVDNTHHIVQPILGGMAKKQVADGENRTTEQD